MVEYLKWLYELDTIQYTIYSLEHYININSSTDSEAPGHDASKLQHDIIKSKINWQLRLHCNLRPHEPCQHFPALPSLKSLNLSVALSLVQSARLNSTQLNSTSWVESGRALWTGLYYSVFAADTLLYAVILIFDPVTLTFGLWPWTFAVYRLWRNETLYTKFERNRTIRSGVIAIVVFDLMTLNIALRVALGSGIIFTNFWPSTTSLCLNYSVSWCWYVTSRCDFNLWPVDIESSWYIKSHIIKVCTKFKRNRAIPGWIIYTFANFLHMLSHAVTLTFDLLTSNFYGTSGVLCLNSVQNLSEIE